MTETEERLIASAAIKGLSMPTMGSFRPERIDQTIDQLERWLGLSAAPSLQPNAE